MAYIYIDANLYFFSEDKRWRLPVENTEYVEFNQSSFFESEAFFSWIMTVYCIGYVADSYL